MPFAWQSKGASRRPSVGSNSTAVSGTGGQNMMCVKPDSHSLATISFGDSP